MERAIVIQPARPRPVTALAILLFLVTIGGIVLTILFSVSFEVGVPRYLIALVGICYSASAFTSAVGFWRMARWSVGVFVLWGVFAVLLSLLMTATAGSPRSRALIIALAATLCVAGLAVYISRQMRRQQR